MADTANRLRLVLMGSARTNGDTAAAVERLADALVGDTKVVALASLRLQAFDYGRSTDDQFLALVNDLAEYESILFATPLYWYAMSGVLKTFFDRLTDVLMDPTKRPLGRALAGRDVWALVVGTDPEPPIGVAEPFRLTASYFGMKWLGLCYARSAREGGFAANELTRIDEFAAAMNERAAVRGKNRGPEQAMR